MRTVIGELIALNNLYLGDDTDAPSVHANALTVPVNLNSLNNNGSMPTSDVAGQPTLLAMKQAVPSYYDMVQMGVMLYNMIVKGVHEIDSTVTPRVTKEMSIDQINSVLKEVTPSSMTIKSPLLGGTQLDVTTPLS